MLSLILKTRVTVLYDCSKNRCFGTSITHALIHIARVHSNIQKIRLTWSNCKKNTNRSEWIILWWNADFVSKIVNLQHESLFAKCILIYWNDINSNHCDAYFEWQCLLLCAMEDTCLKVVYHGTREDVVSWLCLLVTRMIWAISVVYILVWVSGLLSLCMNVVYYWVENIWCTCW